MSVSEAIRLKRAVRKFTTNPLPKETIHAILNAGRRAQSAKNTQHWHFIAITDRATLKALSEYGDWAGHLAGAALAVAIITPHPDTRFSVMFDAGQAAAYMQLMKIMIIGIFIFEIWYFLWGAENLFLFLPNKKAENENILLGIISWNFAKI